MAARKGASTGSGGTITLTRLQRDVLAVQIEGVTPVIPHRWSEKARRMMPGWVPMDGSVPGPRTKEGPRTPREEAEACVYRLPDGRPGIPATAFKAAIVSACRFFKELPMVEAKLLFFVEGIGPDQLVPFEHDGEPVLREDTPRNANGGADLRYRYSFHPWRATLRVHYLPTSITPQSVLALVDAGGNGGVGDWRPSAPKSSTGTFGQFKVVTEDDAVGPGDQDAGPASGGNR